MLSRIRDKGLFFLLKRQKPLEDDGLHGVLQFRNSRYVAKGGDDGRVGYIFVLSRIKDRDVSVFSSSSGTT